MLEALAAVALGQQAAQEDPLAVLAPARETPAAGEAVATLHLLGLAGGHVGGGDQGGGVAAPHILLGLVGEERQLPVVHTDHAVDPGRRHAALGQRHLHPVEDPRVELVAAPALGLQHAEQAGLLHLLHGLDRHHALALGLAGPFGQLRGQGAGAGHQLDRLGRHVVIGKRVHQQLFLYRIHGLPPPVCRWWKYPGGSNTSVDEEFHSGEPGFIV